MKYVTRRPNTAPYSNEFYACNDRPSDRNQEACLLPCNFRVTPTTFYLEKLKPGDRLKELLSRTQWGDFVNTAVTLEVP
jgi:hypothetical protein